jgi:hypothetical protein
MCLARNLAPASLLPTLTSNRAGAFVRTVCRDG